MGRRLVALVGAVLLLTAGQGASASTVPLGEETVAAFGDAVDHGSPLGTTIAHPLVGMAPTPTGDGYWLAAADGGIFSFGDARFFGSMGGTPLNQPIVGIAPTPTGNGYWLAAADGGTFSFGDARFRGSGVGAAVYQPVVGIAPTPTGDGYWLVSSGRCVFRGSTAARDVRPETHYMLLTDVTTGDHECWERVVFEMEDADGAADGAISYQVAYADPPFAGPPGFPIPVDGNAFVTVRFWGASGYDLEAEEETYLGPDEIHPADLESVEELHLVEDFEAILVWVIGLDQRREINVFELDGPDRLVIDIGPPA